MRLDPVLERHLPGGRHTVLDLGCGRGQLLDELSERGYLAVGVDKNDSVRFRMHKGVFIEKDAIEYLRTNDIPFSTIILWDVLEHFPKKDVRILLKFIHNNLTNAGQLILHLPNAEGLFGSRILHSDLTHRWAYTPQLITQLLQKAGFTDIQCYECRPIIHGPVSFLRYVAWLGISTIGRLILAVETGVYNGVVSMNMTVVARKGGAK